MACNFILEKRKKDGVLIVENMPINADINLKGLRIRYATGYRVDLAKWKDEVVVDPNTGERQHIQCVKKNAYGRKGRESVAYNFINSTLKIIRGTVAEIESRMATETFGRNEVIQLIDDRILKVKNAPSEEDDSSFHGLFLRFMKREDVSESRRKNYANVLSNFCHFEQFGVRRKVDFTDCTDKLMESFDSFMATDSNLNGRYNNLTKKLQPKPKGKNTRIRNARVMMTFFKWAAQNYGVKAPAINTYKIEAEIYEDPIFLTIEERNLVYEWKPTNKRLEQVRDMFVFQCYIGTRISDLLALTQNNITADNFVEYIPDKTIKENPRTCRIPLAEKALQILAKYQGRPDRKLFPPIFPQNYNDSLKKILRDAGITRKVIVMDKHGMLKDSVPICDVASSHLARKTFIAALKKQGVADSTIGAMSGHVKGSKAFGRYYAVGDDEKTQAVKAIE